MSRSTIPWKSLCLVLCLLTYGCGVIDRADDGTSTDPSESRDDELVSITAADVAAATAGVKADGEAFENAFPIAVLFRPERFAAADVEIDAWVKYAADYSAVIGKAVEDEFRSPQNARDRSLRLQAFKEAFPKRLVLAHHNGDGFNPELDEVKRHLALPSDWVHYPGADGTTSLPASSDKLCIPVTALDRFKDGLGGRCVGYSGESACTGDDVTLVERDQEGRLDFTHFEYAQVVRLVRGQCPGNGSDAIVMTLRRGTLDRPVYGTKARDFARVYVAAHVVEGPYGDAGKDAVKIWVPNFARNEYRIIEGAAKVFAELFARRASEEKAALGGIDGVTLDVSDDSLLTLGGDKRRPDVNWDGRADDGIFQGRDNWREGRAEFYRKLRLFLGDRVILADGGAHFNQKSVAELDGIEAEKFTPGDRLLSEFSSGVNRILAWRDRPVRAKDRSFSYVVNKIDPEMAKDPVKSRQFLRMLSAYETVLGLGIAMGSYGSRGLTMAELFPKCESSAWAEKLAPLDELVGGDLDSPRWLGAADHAIRRLALRSPDLLRSYGRKLNREFTGKVGKSAAQVTIAKGSDGTASLKIAPKGGAETDIRFTLEDMPLAPNADLTLSLEVRANNRSGGNRGFDSYRAIPRTLFANLGNGKFLADNQAGELSALMVGAASGGFQKILFTWRAKARHDETVTSISLRAEGPEPIEIRNLTLHASPDAMVRAFANGVVLANMSRHHSVKVPLADLFPGRAFRRLTSTSCQSDGVNDGRPVGGTVTLGPEEGLFLRND